MDGPEAGVEAVHQLVTVLQLDQLERLLGPHAHDDRVGKRAGALRLLDGQHLSSGGGGGVRWRGGEGAACLFSLPGSRLNFPPTPPPLYLREGQEEGAAPLPPATEAQVGVGGVQGPRRVAASVRRPHGAVRHLVELLGARQPEEGEGVLPDGLLLQDPGGKTEGGWGVELKERHALSEPLLELSTSCFWLHHFLHPGCLKICDQIPLQVHSCRSAAEVGGKEL